MLTFTDAGGARVFCFALHKRRRVVDRSAAVTCVNSSLSRTLFFSICWCIRNDVHFDSRMHAATKPTTSEGTMAKKAKKKAKSAVKKTAKKTRKVAKKKK